jgi:hypothetical protein
MNDVEKRELFEQQQKIFEAGVQRADKRAGSFSFLTWSFFIAPMIACEEFLAAMFKSAAAVEEDAKTAQAGAAPQAANEHPPASDLSKTSAEDETAKGPAASPEAHATQLDPTGLLAQPQEDAPKPSTARSEAVAAARGGGGGGGDDADSLYHDAHTSIDDSSVNALSADSHLGSSQLPGGSTLESVQSNVLGDSFSPSIIGSAHLLGTVGSLSNDVVGAIAPVEAAVQPVLTTATDTVSTLPNDVAGATAPVEAAVQPVLMTATDTVSTLPNDVAGAIAPVEAAVQPVLTTATDTVSTLSNDVVGADPSSHGVTDTSNVAAPHVGSAGWVSGAVTPVAPDLVDVWQAAPPDTTGGLTDRPVASAAPLVDTADPLLAAMTGADSQSTTLSQTAASDSAGAHTLGSSAPALDVAEPAPATASGATGDVAQPGNVASDALANAAPVVETTEPVLTTTAAALSHPTSDVSHPADTGNVASDALPSAAPIVDTTEPVLASAGVSHSNPATDLLQPVAPDTSAGQAPGPADTLLALATATNAPIEVPGSATTAAPAEVVTDVSNGAAAVHPTAIAGDVIALNDAPPPPENALFTGTQYTDYGVTLSSDIAVPPQHAVSSAGAVSAHDTSVPVVADVQQHTPPPPDIVDTTHPIDHLGHAIL